MTYRALVTGAGREGGIGQAIVRRLEADGMEVVTLDKEPGCTWQVDVARDELPDFGPIDVYVANTGGPPRFEDLDSDHDGAVTLAEFQAKLEQHFAMFDANKDGVLSHDELDAAHRGMHPPRP